MIETEGLGKTYETRSIANLFRPRQSVPALVGVDLSILDGEIFGLLGVNGAGKTTLTKILATLLEPTSGRAMVGGLDVTRHAAKLKSRVNMVTGGERMLYSRLSGRENLLYFARLYDVPTRMQSERINRLLDLVGLSEAADRRVEQYSKGMKQRLQIARGLINEPEYLFLDEPTLGLDAPIARDIRALIQRELEMTVVFTSHYMHEMDELCDRVAVINEGRLLEVGTPAELRKRYKRGHTVVAKTDRLSPEAHSRIAALAASGAGTVEVTDDEAGSLMRIDTQIPVTRPLVDLMAELCLPVLELREEEPSLEDVLVAVVAGETP